ncbi:MAG TPA: PIG-L family deacetylase, partial [Bacteroidota bacterium]|nr:PIG-L family deacetylase [Bacteroidota bacterium]
MLSLLFPFLVRAQVEPGDVRQALRDLSHDGVLMDLSAHPDDEDGATLAYYRMKLGVRTYSVLFTRGEGGQNEKGPELYEDLGVLRSEETREAGRVLGAEVRFLNFLDFGFSKTATETFQKWGGEREALRRLVYVIRKYRPDVLFTNHNTIDGHGNHQAVAITAVAAFDAAADSTFFPEQLREE